MNARVTFQTKLPLFNALIRGVAVLLVVGVGVVQAGLPQPLCIYYGQARDGYGQPYLTNASVILRSGTNEIARYAVGGSITPGVNFVLNVHLDDGRTSRPYSSRALHSGDLVTIVVRDALGEKVIMENKAVPAVGQPGEIMTINATAADDEDEDGLPDLWEQELIAWSDGALRTLADVRGFDDFDGDGVSNLNEYSAGTFAFLDYDYLHVEQTAATPNHRLRLTFLGVAGKAYRALTAPALSSSEWESITFALSDRGSAESTVIEGNGEWLSVYIPIQEPARFFRISAE